MSNERDIALVQAGIDATYAAVRDGGLYPAGSDLPDVSAAAIAATVPDGQAARAQPAVSAEDAANIRSQFNACCNRDACRRLLDGEKAQPAGEAVACRPDFRAMYAAADDYLSGYEMIGEGPSGQDGYYTPTAADRALIQDFIAGLFCEDDFVAAISQTAPPAQVPTGQVGIVEQLWSIIDDIDTYGDMAKGDDAEFRRMVEKRQKDRWKTGITTDGYSLTIPQVRVPSVWYDVVAKLIALAHTTNIALDDSEEREGDDGREHVISSFNFDAVCSALDALEELPDDKPGYASDAAGKAEWALRELLAAPQPKESKE